MNGDNQKESYRLPKEPDFSTRVLSGIQPTGDVHFGNFFGAIKQHIELQHEYPGDAFYFIADYHALTTIHNSERLREQTRSVALDYLALGLDPQKATLYRQSDVPEVCELMWILACVTGKGLLDRAHAFKDKEKRGVLPSLGLYLYPELMAADILAVRSTIVPVGEDQKQHLEICRDIARSFNTTFDVRVFPLPELRLNEAAIVPGVDGQKMSKSYNNTIRVFAADEELQVKIASIKTSSVRRGEPINPDTDTTFALYHLITAPPGREEMRQRYLSGSIGYREAKAELLVSLQEYFAPFKEKRASLLHRGDEVEQILQDGACRARGQIRETLEIVRDCVGLSRFHRNLTI